MNNKYNHKAINILVWVIFISYSACLLFWMFRGFGRVTHTDFRFNYVPLRTILGFIVDLSSLNLLTTTINLAGNIGVFIPFGIILPYIFKGLRRYSLFTVYFITAIIILEIMQTVLRVGIGDIDDVILNYIGASIGFLLYRSFLCKQLS
ncbi:VanZ family protein [Paenibacillus lentus]|uniref:VanZ family protein n=1 Tax=Paenibacillus lentus TaxID=1338368 RepID=UPI00365B0FBE